MMWIGIGCVVFVGLYMMLTYNKLIKLKNIVEEAWSGIDVQLKQRSNLIPNLISTVKGYMTHEQSLLEKLTELRSRSMNASSVKEQGEAESALGGQLFNMFALAENYPDLKANVNFMKLQDQLQEIEDYIQKSRRYYNGAVRDYNTTIESFPSNIVAGMFSFAKREFFEIENPAERAVPKVEF